MRKLQIGLMALASAALPARGQSVEWFARKGVEALGGAGKLEAVRSERMTGRIGFGSEADLPFVVELKRPRKIRTQVDFKAGTFVQGFDGKIGWVSDPSRGGKPVEMPPEQARNLPEQADMDGPLLRWKRRGIRLEVEGREKVRGIDALRIRVTLANGIVRYLDLDASTYRKVRWQGELGEGDRKQVNESFFTDYRKVGELLFPFRIESGAGGRVTQTIVFEKVEVNPPIDDSRFSMPK
jgi:outer membrane lipoprotein-sorting protein